MRKLWIKKLEADILTVYLVKFKVFDRSGCLHQLGWLVPNRLFTRRSTKGLSAALFTRPLGKSFSGICKAFLMIHVPRDFSISSVCANADAFHGIFIQFENYIISNSRCRTLVRFRYDFPMYGVGKLIMLLDRLLADHQTAIRFRARVHQYLSE